MQPQQQRPTPPIYMKYTNIGLPKHTIVLLLTTYVPNTQHNALHCNRNMILGSSGVAKSFKWMGIGIVYPPYHKSTIEAIHKARMATKILHHNHNHMQPSCPKNPRNTQRYLPNPWSPPRHLMNTIPHPKGPIPTPTRKSIHINKRHPQPKNISRILTNNSNTHNQHLGTLQRTFENQPTTIHTPRSQIQIHRTMASNPQNYPITLI